MAAIPTPTPIPIPTPDLTPIAQTIPTSDHQVALEILEKIDHFYFSAWSILIGALGVLVLVGGVIIPLITIFVQKRIFQVEEARLLKSITDKIAEEKQGLIEQVKSELAAMKSEHEKKLQSETDDMRVGIFMLQSSFNRNHGHLAHALLDTARAIGHAMRCGNHAQAQANMVDYKELLGVMPKSSIEQAQKMDPRLVDLVKRLKERDKDGIYFSFLEDMEKAETDAMKRP